VQVHVQLDIEAVVRHFEENNAVDSAGDKTLEGRDRRIERQSKDRRKI
jgi:hypothetical protein